MKKLLTLAGISSLLCACTAIPVPVTPGIVLPTAVLRPTPVPVYVPQADPVIAQHGARNNNPLPVTPAVAIPASYSPTATITPPSVTPASIPSISHRSTVPVVSPPAATPAVVSVNSGNTPPPETNSGSIQNLSWLATKIMNNQTGNNAQKLVDWNNQGNFATLGVGNFIWYPANKKGRYTESFPAYVEYAKTNGATPPRWLNNQYKQGAPWPDGGLFNRAQNDSQMRELRDFMQKTQNLQANFMAVRLQQTIPVILQSLPGSERQRVQNNYQTILRSPGGLYPLLDYVQFKGNGLNPAERYNNQGWGLLQVLQEMHNTQPGPAALAEFRRAADDVLVRRIANAPATSRDARSLSQWLNRISTYNPGRTSG